jgi:hypothetical protein
VDTNNFDVWAKFFKGYLMTQKPCNLETAFDEIDLEDEVEMNRLMKLRRKAYGYLMMACQNDSVALQIATSPNVIPGDCIGLYKLLEARFSLKLPATLNSERGLFFKMKCAVGESTDKFVDRVKEQVTKIANFGAKFIPSDDEILTVLMEGIKEQFSTLWTTIFTSPKSLDEMYKLLQEYKVDRPESAESKIKEVANFTNYSKTKFKKKTKVFKNENKNFRKFSSRGRSGGRGNNRESEGEFRLKCHNCGSFDHLAFKCPESNNNFISNKNENGNRGNNFKKKYEYFEENESNNGEEDDHSNINNVSYHNNNTSSKFSSFQNRRGRGGRGQRPWRGGRGYLVIEDAAEIVAHQVEEELINIDSGANRLIIRNKDWFDNLELDSGTLKLAGQGASLNINGVGNIGSFQNVKWCSSARDNLLSVAKLNEIGFKTIFCDDDGVPVKIIDKSSGSVISTGIMKNDLFWITESDFKKIANHFHQSFNNYGVVNYSLSSNTSTSSSSVSINLADGYRSDKLFLLHERLGHLNTSTILESIKNDLFLNTGLKNKDCRKNIDRPLCNICARAKITRTIFSKIHKIRGKNFGDYISVDLALFPSIPSREGYKYVLTIIDHASKKSFVFPLKNRNGVDIINCIKKFFESVKSLNARIKHYHADGGPELISKELLLLLKDIGATYTWNPADTPELNSTSERRFRTLGERTICLLIRSGLPKAFWWDAYEASNYITNHLPTKTSKGYISPEEFLKGVPPDISHFRVWGCQTFARKPRNYLRKDLSDKTYSGYFIGYSTEGEIGYKIWVPSLKEVVISIHCNFNEVIPDYRDEYFEELTKYDFSYESREMNPSDFQHLVGAKYVDNDDWLEYVNTKVGVVDRNIVVWRAPVIDSKGNIGIEEDAPIHVSDVIKMMGSTDTPSTRQELEKQHNQLVRLREETLVRSREELRARSMHSNKKRAREDIGQFTRPAPADDLDNDSIEVTPRTMKRLEKKLDSKKKAYSKTPGRSELASQRGRPDGGGGTSEKSNNNSYMPPLDSNDRNYDEKESVLEPQEPVDHSMRERRKRVATKLLNVGKLGSISEISTVANLLKEVDEEVEPQSFDEANSSSLWRKSMREEIKNMENRSCWKIVKRPSGKKFIRSRYVYKIKRDFSGKIKKRKSRLVIQGFRQDESDYSETYAPVVKGNTFRLLVALARTLGLDIQHMDVDAAFLYADLDEDIYMEPPPNVTVPDGCCIKLLKSLYGLKQAPRNWYQNIKMFIESRGFKQSVLDNCLYIYKTDDHITLISLYVDDILIAGSDPEYIQQLKSEFSSQYDMKDLGRVEHYLGMRISWIGDDIKVDQQSYVSDLVTRFSAQLRGYESKKYSSPMARELKLSKNDLKTMSQQQQQYVDSFPYQSIVGALLYLAINTRPDIAYSINSLARFNSCPTFQSCKAAIRVLCYVRDTSKLGLNFCSDELNLNCFSDSDWAGDVDSRRSTTGYVVFAAGTPIAWCSKLQTTIAISSMEAEYMAAFFAVQEVVWLKGVLSEMDLDYGQPVPLLIDNQSAIRLAKNPMYHKRSKHIEIKWHWLREKVAEQHVVELVYVRSMDNTADIFTKALGIELHSAHQNSVVR